MKKRYNKFFIVGMLAILMMVGCTKDFETINEDVNLPPEVATSYLMTSAQKQLMDNIWDEWFNGRFGMMYSQYWSQTSYTDESRFKIRDNNTDSYWRSYYTGLMDLEEIIKLNQNEETAGEMAAYGKNENQIASAMILKVWMFQIMTDIWGDIPYSEALAGSDNMHPKFDAQQDVYDDIIIKLDEAIALIDVNSSGSAGDVIYNGDMSKWMKFAYSLKMRIAMRMSGVNGGAAATIINASKDHAFTSNDDNALFNYLPNVPNNNPLNENSKTRADFAVSEPFVNMLNGLNDPRIATMADHPINLPGEYVGFPYGLDNANANLIPNEDVCMPGVYVYDAVAPGVLMDYAEVCFILSEHNGYDQSWYENGITASMGYWMVDAAAAETYLTTVPAASEQTVAEQKYIALYMQGLQGWFEYNRTGYPVLEGPIDGSFITIDTPVPTRRTYPNDEQLLNNENYLKAVANQGTDDMDTKLWWQGN